MLGEGGTPLSKLEAAVREFVALEDRRVDPRRLRALIDALDGEFAVEVRDAKRSGDHLADGSMSATTWISRTCGMSVPSASDRLCVGEQLASLPMVAEALSRGEISYQSAAVICHFRDKLGEKGDGLDEEEWIGYARKHSIKDLAWIAAHTRYAVDPEGFDRDTEENYDERFLHVSEMNGMYHLSGVMDPEAGAASRLLSTRWPSDSVKTTAARPSSAGSTP